MKIADCGHELKDGDNGYLVRYKDFDFDFNFYIHKSVVCKRCADEMEKFRECYSIERIK